MHYLRKPNKDFNNSLGKNLSFSGEYQKPATCPHCGVSIDGILGERSVINIDSSQIFSSACRCTACGKSFFFSCHRVPSSSDISQMIAIWPASDSSYTNKNLHSISPRFIDMYNQALRSESKGDIELAAIGFRSALEILVKDYAVNELKINVEEVSRKSLFDAIGEYLKQKELLKTADVVRIFGNDYTHYQEKYPNKDFEILKSYMQIFLHLVETQYMINHPPVSR